MLKTIKEVLAETLVEGFKIKNHDIKDAENDNAKKFKDFFGKSKFRIKLKDKEFYFNFTIHAMSRYMERDAVLDKSYLDSFLTKVLKGVQHKEKDQLFLVYSNSLKRAIVVVKKSDDLFNVVTVYPEGEHVQSKNTKKMITENLFDYLIEEVIDVE